MAKELFLLDSNELFLLLSLLKLALYAGCVEEGEYTSCTGKMRITATSLSHLCESAPHDLFLPCVQVYGIHQSIALTILEGDVLSDPIIFYLGGFHILLGPPLPAH
jgi:positive regulator of sigma E activity